MDRANSHTKSYNIPRSFEAMHVNIKYELRAWVLVGVRKKREIHVKLHSHLFLLLLRLRLRLRLCRPNSRAYCLPLFELTSPSLHCELTKLLNIKYETRWFKNQIRTEEGDTHFDIYVV